MFPSQLHSCTASTGDVVYLFLTSPQNAFQILSKSGEINSPPAGQLPSALS